MALLAEFDLAFDGDCPFGRREKLVWSQRTDSCDPANPSWRLYVRLGFEPLPAGPCWDYRRSVKPLLTVQRLPSG
jgi:hypothetical protein